MFFIGALVNFLIEMSEMIVDGPKKYFKKGWNFIDLLVFIFSIAFIAVLIVVKNDYEKARDYENILKLLKVSILLVIWIKITWFQKLFKDFGLL